MTFALFARRRVIVVLGGAFVLLGVLILCTNLPIAGGWTQYAAVSSMAFYPGLPVTHGGGITSLAQARYASFTGQILILLGITLMAVWTGFRLAKR